ncbi:MAG: hypothetical protein KY476_22320 [Planctomycetes bacterium]|nr:hypothetical protein [Planctomycetota bacterium]
MPARQSRPLWAPLVFGRTLKVDFRLLAIPEGMAKADVQWLQSHINGSTVYPDDLRDGHRWSLFKNDRYCGFGLTCMAQLVSTHRVIVENRELYLFAGYVSRIDRSQWPDPPHHPPLPILPAVDRPPFDVLRTLYEYVDFLWNDDRTMLDAEEIATEIEKPYASVKRLDSLLETPRAVARRPKESLLNYNSRKLLLLPDDHDNVATGNAAYWAEAVTTSKPVSLVIGLPDEWSAKKGPFLNAATASTTERHSITRDGKEAEDEPAERAPRPHREDRYIQRTVSRRPAERKSNYDLYAVRFIDVMQDVAAEATAGEGESDWIDYDKDEYDL